MQEAAKGQRPSEWLSTHPAEATRIEQIQGWLPEALQYVQEVASRLRPPPPSAYLR